MAISNVCSPIASRVFGFTPKGAGEVCSPQRVTDRPPDTFSTDQTRRLASLAALTGVDPKPQQDDIPRHLSWPTLTIIVSAVLILMNVIRVWLHNYKKALQWVNDLEDRDPKVQEEAIGKLNALFTFKRLSLWHRFIVARKVAGKIPVRMDDFFSDKGNDRRSLMANIVGYLTPLEKKEFWAAYNKRLLEQVEQAQQAQREAASAQKKAPAPTGRKGNGLGGKIN